MTGGPTRRHTGLRAGRPGMRRRSMLAALAVGSVAGCGTRLPPFARTPSSIAPSATPVLDDLSCPPASVDGPTVCAHEVDATAVPVVVRATDHVAPIDDASGVAFVLTNATDGTRPRYFPTTTRVRVTGLTRRSSIDPSSTSPATRDAAAYAK